MLSSSDGGHEVTVVGLLVDAEDLYAQVPARIDSLKYAGGLLSGTISLASARPVRTRIETVATLGGSWSESTDADVSKQAEAGQHDFSILVPTKPDEGFLRPVAQPRGD